MAFHQPTRQVQQRVARVESEDGDSAILAPHVRPEANESQTWVLFTPGTDAETATSYLSSVHDGQTTPGRSRISDLGSLDHVARSDFNSRPSNSAVPSDVLEDSVAEEDAELDSLDSHLPDFRVVPNPYGQHEVPHATPVLPGHDGLGSFHLDTEVTTAAAQDRLYAFEQFNPNRVRHRKESFDRARLELDNEEVQEAERNQRVEAWRLEQSRILLDDIRRETRRRRQSELSLQRPQKRKDVTDSPAVADAAVTADEADDIRLDETDWHDQDEPKASPPEPTGGLWSRITRKVICDLMGIDDRLLAILFGEALPDEDELSSTPKASTLDSSRRSAFARMGESSDESTWQLRTLERIARELGVLVHQLSAHPGAFSTYAHVQQMALPYAGLPAIPESPVDSSENARAADDSIVSMPQFKPTLGQPPAPTTSSAPITPPAASAAEVPQTFTQQEWEQDLDIRLVFRYLRSRFTSSRPSSPPYGSSTAHLATSSTQDMAAKAARVCQHHPLVSHAHVHGHSHAHGHHRNRQNERRAFKVAAPTSPVVHIRHPSGSCASQSTRRSARRSSMSSRQSSRHYWDIGGSIGTGSVVAGTGPMGSWGEA